MPCKAWRSSISSAYRVRKNTVLEIMPAVAQLSNRRIDEGQAMNDLVAVEVPRDGIPGADRAVPPAGGDGTISAIHFRLNIEKVEDPDGGHRAVITRDGKYLPAK